MGELFCGPGGIARGLDFAVEDLRKEGVEVDVEHTWANDYDAATARTYKANFPGAHVIHKDIRKLDIETELSDIDGFAFGFPCNDFSVVGEQKGIDGTFGPLYEYGARVVDRYSPKWFFAENVGGLRNSNDGVAFEMILDRLQEAGAPEYGGYTLYPHLYKFEEYGVPQRRHRIIIVGVRNDLEVDFRVPSPEPYSHIDNSVKTALSNIPADATHQELTRQNPTVVERLSHIKPGENAFTADLPAHLQLNVQGAKISQIYRRLQADKPSYTVTGSGGGGTHVYHYEENRALTNRERARIQTFPDDYIFEGKKEEVRKQIGMAVPVDGARVVFKALLSSLEGIEYPSVEPNLLRSVPPRREASASERSA
ncbi:DNA cytosine methyltransferase [Microbacterium hydrocarbonoxydans]|uniref:DNA cytosine methyltransferase n=1 Tax=Microbacterium hydrocarbonoxydans TaxID=273678 RepID=UPI001FB9247E|nr:DNA cytosine methyltransferase [Microbacterium hydrocarbonoxydans]